MQGGLAAVGGASILGGDIASFEMQNSAIAAQKSAVQLEGNQAQLAFAQRTLANINQTSQLIQVQAVKTAGRGESLASGSFKATSEATFNAGQQTQTNLDTAGKVAQLSAQAKEDALDTEQNLLPFELAGNIAQQGLMFGKMAYG